MGNCPPLPCPSPCPDLALQDICANNSCHGCCIFHGCCNSKPSSPAWDSPPPVQLRQLPDLPAEPCSAAKGPAATMARGVGGVARDLPANGYRFRPSPWGTEPGLAATTGAPPGVPGNGDPVPWFAGSSCLAAETAINTTGHDGGGGVPRDGDRRAPPSSRRTETATAWATGCDDDGGGGVARDRGQPVRRTESSGCAETWATGAAARDMPLAAPLGVPGHGHPPSPSLPRRPARSGWAQTTGATVHDSGVPPRHGDRRAPPPPSWRTEPAGSAETTWAACRDDDGHGGVARNPGHQRPSQPARRALSGLAETWATGAATPALRLTVGVEWGQDSRMERDTSSPAPLPASRSRDPHGRLPLSPSPSLSLSAAGRLSPAESRRRFPQASGAGTHAHDVGI